LPQKHPGREAEMQFASPGKFSAITGAVDYLFDLYGL
jgi:hypothetical protein